MIRHIEKVRYGTIDEAFVDQMLTAPDDGPVLMLNLMRYRIRADYPDDGGEAPDITGREADDRYAPLGVLADIGAEIVLFGDVVSSSGDDAWERVAVVRYPSFRAFVEMQSRPDFLAAHRHKEAGMERTVIAACYPESAAIAAEVRRPEGWLRLDLYADRPDAGDTAVGSRWRVAGCPVRDERTWAAVDLTPCATPEPPTYVPGRVSVVVDALLDRLAHL